jgi:hypothetical protein
MPNDSYTQQALAADSTFISRLKSNLSNVAWQVIGESDDVEFHDEREKFARTVINQINFYAQQFAPWLVERPNLIQFETSYNFPAGAVVTAAGDADIQSQLMSDWNEIGGIPAPQPNVVAPQGRAAEALPILPPLTPGPPPDGMNPLDR